MNYLSTDRLTKVPTGRIIASTLPIVLIVAAVIFLLTNTWVALSLGSYLNDVEDPGEWASLYMITVPLLVLAMPLFVLKWYYFRDEIVKQIIFCALYPVSVSLSIWLWEWLGVILMGFVLLFAWVILNVDSDEKKGGVGIMVYLGIIFVLYILARIRWGHQGIQDVALLVLYGGYLLRHAVTILFVPAPRIIRRINFYYFFPLIVSLLMLGLFLYSGSDLPIGGDEPGIEAPVLEETVDAPDE